MSIYRCEPVFHPDPGEPAQPLPGQKMFLVCGKYVQAPGYYVSWPSADAQYKGVSGATLKGYRDFAELRRTWHSRCDLGEHDHPIDPAVLQPRAPLQPPQPPVPPVQPPATPVRPPRALSPPAAAPVWSPPVQSQSVGTPGQFRQAPHVPLYVIESRSPSPTHASLPPPYNPIPDVSLSGLMCYAVRVGQDGETFTDLLEARDRFHHLQNAGLSPAFMSSPSLTRCLNWIEQAEPSPERQGWEEAETLARRQHVQSQRWRHRCRLTVIQALDTLRVDDDGDDDGDDELSCTTDDLEEELQARINFGENWWTLTSP
ncbi:hypothetical protein C8R45DRAFT_1101210 [Mycena sanguinolenta]|nr:hypothetical protein C8R45DRAFT_1101210 [Mycena sanguinolenta]